MVKALPRAAHWASLNELSVAPSCLLMGLFSLVLLFGCGTQKNTLSTPSRLSLSGIVSTGKQPISGSIVQVYAANIAGDPGVADPMIAEPALTDATGSFSISVPYTCPTPDSLIYLVARGGNPGLAPGILNYSIVLMAALGSCKNLSMYPSVSVNEVTTIGSVFLLAPYIKASAPVSLVISDMSQFNTSVESVGQLINVVTGTAQEAVLSEGEASPATKLYTLANAISGCVKSTGGTSGDSSACGNLFSSSNYATEAVPNDTLAAVLAIAQNPTQHINDLLTLSFRSPVFQPALTSTPEDWVLRLLSAPAISPASGTYRFGQPITMTERSAGAKVYYTTDGSLPDSTSLLYSNSLTLSQTERVRAVAFRNTLSSPEASAQYNMTDDVSVSMSPLSATLTQSGTQKFTATISGGVNGTVSWSLLPTVGTISASGLYTAPATLTVPQVIAVTATSTVNSAKTATSLITLTPPVKLGLSPVNVSLTPLQMQLFTATVSNTANTNVTWSLNPGIGSISSNGAYVAPATITGSQTVTVTATSIADTTKHAIATIVLLPPISVTVTPAQSNLTSSQSERFIAAVSGGTYATVSWSLNPNLGRISSSGLYTAPSAISSPKTVAVVATSTVDPTKAASATIALVPETTISYYVANNGNDLNDGKRAATPWQTLARLNATKLNGGDSVFLQCGSLFREALTLAQSGSSASPIAYGSYGACTGSNLPIISGADLLSGWIAESQGAFVDYYAYVTAQPATLFEDHHRLPLLSAKADLTPGSSFYDSSNRRVYVRTREDGNPTSHLLEASTRSYCIFGYQTSFLTINGIEADEAALNGITIGGNVTDITISGVSTNFSHNNGVYFTANLGETQNNILLQDGTANYNGGNGISKGNGGTNVIISRYTANYNAFDPAIQYSGGIRLVSDGATDNNRPTYSGVRDSTTDFNGINPDTNIGVSSATGSGVGVWCDTCGIGSFLTGNEGHGNTQAGAQLEFTGTTGGQSMTGNREWGNFYGILHTRRSHSDLIAGNTTWGNYINCQFSGESGGAETTVGMVGNTYENNICASQVMNSTGSVVVAEWGAENNLLGEGSGNIYRNNSFGVPDATNGTFAMFGRNANVSTYALLDAAYGASMKSITGDPLLANPSSGDLRLTAGSPAIGAGIGGVDLGAVPYNLQH